MKIIKDFLQKGRLNRPALPMNPKYITIHDTGNSESFCNADFFSNHLKNTNLESSWHFTVDEHKVIQHIPLNENVWHCSDGEDGVGNRQSIAIEICVYDGQDDELAKQKAKELCHFLMKEFDIPLHNIKQHHDWDFWSNCPISLRKEDNWDKFIDSIRSVEEESI